MLAADIYGAAPHVGCGGWTWYKLSAGWMHRAGREWILGFRVQAGMVILDPCIAESWPGFEIMYRHRTATYQIRVENPHGASSGIASAMLDGVALQGIPQGLKLDDDGKTYSVHVLLGDIHATPATAE